VGQGVEVIAHSRQVIGRSSENPEFTAQLLVPTISNKLLEFIHTLMARVQKRPQAVLFGGSGHRHCWVIKF
jgi:hypothetical protein